MSIARNVKSMIGDFIQHLGYKIMKLETYKNFLQHQDQGHKLDLLSNTLMVRDNEETEVVSKMFLQTLLRESRLLREQAGELATLKREFARLSINDKNAAKESPTAHQETLAGEMYSSIYNYAGLYTDPKVIHNHDFMKSPKYRNAYQRGVKAYEHDDKYYWRVHVALWCASVAANLDGDFVECGVWKGFLCSAIMQYLDWNTRNKRCVLFDTFNGLDETLLTDEEILTGNVSHFRSCYQKDVYEQVVKNFAEFKNVEIIRGSIPSSLESVEINKIAYLSIDMNNATPEIAAANYFWDKLVKGGLILLDDYGFVGYEAQKKAFDKWAEEKNVEIFAIPTGQGLIVKP